MEAKPKHRESKKKKKKIELATDMERYQAHIKNQQAVQGI